MPWRGPSEPGEYPTLGYEAADWIEAHCVIPDGDHLGEPYLLTDEMVRWLLRYYRLRPTPDGGARFLYRGGQLMRVQKWGKGPFAGSQTLLEAFGPVRFDGWDSYGEPVGKPWPTPWVQLAAVSEDQTDNTYLAVYEMAARGAVANIPGVDIGVEDINLPSGGKIEPVTSAGRTRLGQRLTFAVQDETHLWTPTSGGKLLAANMRRNLAGMGGRWMETTNAYDPAEASVAQVTHEGAAPDVLLDVRTGPSVVSLNDRPELLKALAHRYGDSWWVDLERIADEIADPGTDESDARRFFLNEFVAGTRAFVDPLAVDLLVRDDTDKLRAGDTISLGFDGAKYDDATVLIATRIRDGRQFEIRSWEKPKDVKGAWKVPGPEVDGVVRNCFAVYDVLYLIADPWKWQDYLDAWAGDFGERVVEFPTNVQQRMDRAIERYLTAFKTGEITYDHRGEVLLQHLKNAVLSKGSKKRARDEDDTDPLATHYLKLAKRKKTLKIDAAVAAVLSWYGRAMAIKDGALESADVADQVW
jgi:hypothetical protein